MTDYLRTVREYIPRAVRREILAGGCAYCEDDAAHVDHVVPLSRGGTNDRENLAGACRRCNEEKLDSTPDEWRAWREERGMSWPPLPRCVEMMEAALAVIAEHFAEA